jgi:uncharacterized integral membrane protein
MQFLKTLFWVMLAVVLVLFSTNNWNVVTVSLWGPILVDAKLPVLVIGAFLLGFLPTFLIYRARLWTLQRRLDTTGAPVANAPFYERRPVPAEPPPPQ